MIFNLNANAFQGGKKDHIFKHFFSTYSDYINDFAFSSVYFKHIFWEGKEKSSYTSINQIRPQKALVNIKAKEQMEQSTVYLHQGICGNIRGFLITSHRKSLQNAAEKLTTDANISKVFAE